MKTGTQNWLDFIDQNELQVHESKLIKLGTQNGVEQIIKMGVIF